MKRPTSPLPRNEEIVDDSGPLPSAAAADDVGLLSVSLRELREKAGLTLEAVGTIMGHSATAIFKTEVQERTGKVSLWRLSEMARALGYELHYGFVPVDAHNQSSLDRRAYGARLQSNRKKYLKFDHRAAMKKLMPLERVAWKGLALHPHTRILASGNQEVVLTPAEVLLLHRLMTARGKQVSQDTLMTLVWDEAAPRRLDTLRMLVSKIRAKLSALNVDPDALVATYGQGYELDIP